VLEQLPLTQVMSPQLVLARELVLMMKKKRETALGQDRGVILTLTSAVCKKKWRPFA
jgi:hypothetical protein